MQKYMNIQMFYAFFIHYLSFFEKTVAFCNKKCYNRKDGNF